MEAAAQTKTASIRRYSEGIDGDIDAILDECPIIEESAWLRGISHAVLRDFCFEHSARFERVIALMRRRASLKLAGVCDLQRSRIRKNQHQRLQVAFERAARRVLARIPIETGRVVTRAGGEWAR